MSPKNILIITYNDYPVYEGLGVRIENLARVYAKTGHKVTIYAPNIEKKREKKEELNGLNILRVNIPVPIWLQQYRIFARGYSMLFQTLLTFSVYFKYLKKERIDVIQAEHVYSIPPALIIKALSATKGLRKYQYPIFTSLLFPRAFGGNTDFWLDARQNHSGMTGIKNGIIVSQVPNHYFLYKLEAHKVLA